MEGPAVRGKFPQPAPHETRVNPGADVCRRAALSSTQWHLNNEKYARARGPENGSGKERSEEMQETPKRCYSLSIKAQTDIDQLSAWASRDPSDLPVSPVSSIYFKVECVCECCTWSLRSLLCPLLAPVLGFLTVPNQSVTHRGALRQKPPVLQCCLFLLET